LIGSYYWIGYEWIVNLNQAADLIQKLREIDFMNFGVAYLGETAVLCIRKSEIEENRCQLIEDFVEQNELSLLEKKGYLLLSSKAM
jgi:hypothetical protein